MIDRLIALTGKRAVIFFKDGSQAVLKCCFKSKLLDSKLKKDARHERLVFAPGTDLNVNLVEHITFNQSVYYPKYAKKGMFKELIIYVDTSNSASKADTRVCKPLQY